MHLGIKQFVGGAKKYLFGDGTYSQNILMPYTNSMGTIFGTLPGGGGAASCFNGTVDNYGSAATVVENAGAGYNGTWYGVGKTFTDTVKFTQAQIKAPANGGFLSTAGYACSVRLQITEDGTTWTTFWSRTSSGGGVGEVITVDMTAAPSVKGVKAEVQSNGTNGIWIAELALTGNATLQPQASYSYYGPDLAPAATITYNGAVQQGVVGNLVDGNTGTFFGLTNATGNAFIFDLGSAKSIRRAQFIINGGSYGITFKVQYGDSPTGPWTDTNQTAAVSPLGASGVLVYVNDYGAHRYWRIAQAAANYDGSWYFQASTINLYEYIPLPNCVLITGASTVAPDAVTGAAVFTAQNVLIDGGSLSPSTNCKGLIGIVSGSIRLINGGKAHIDKLGKAGNFGNLTVLDLVPQSIKKKLKGSLAAYVALGEGAAGALGSGGYLDGKAGSAAGAMQTGGGGSGGLNGYNPSSSGKGGKGGPCCGGSGSPGITSNNTTPYYAPDANPYGGPGLNATSDTASWAAGGGTGDTPGTGANGGYTPTSGGGGLLMFFTPTLTIASGCIVSADGTPGVTGSNTYQTGSGGAGGGCVAIGTLAGGYANSGTVRASGGAGTTGATHKNGGPGGVGSVNTFTLAA